MGKPGIGVQLLIFGERNQSDFAGVLKDVKDAGYDAFETPGNPYRNHDPAAVKKAVETTGLKVAGNHGGYGEFVDEESLVLNIRFLKDFGAKYLICSGVAEGDGIAAYDNSAGTFNDVGRRCKDEGLVFCYHNHNWEFVEFDGVKAIHHLAAITDPELVKFCTDVYWVHVGGENPAEFLDRYKNRIEYVHFKDGAPGSFTELGKGEVDLPSAYKAAMALDPEWLVCEQDRTELDPAQSIRESREYLRTLGS